MIKHDVSQKFVHENERPTTNPPEQREIKTSETHTEVTQLREKLNKLIQAIETHRHNIWGEGEVEHDEDKDLYEVLSKIGE